MAFNPLSNKDGFSTQFYTLPISDYTFRVTGTKIRKQKMQDEEKAIIDIQTRVVTGPAEAIGKSANIQCIIGTVDPSTGDLNTDENGNPIADTRQLATIFHAAFGYGLTPEEDARFNMERDGLDLTWDVMELKLPGSGYTELVGCEFEATVTHRTSKGKIYPNFTSIRMVGGE